MLILASCLEETNLNSINGEPSLIVALRKVLIKNQQETFSVCRRSLFNKLSVYDSKSTNGLRKTFNLRWNCEASASLANVITFQVDLLL